MIRLVSGRWFFMYVFFDCEVGGVIGWCRLVFLCCRLWIWLSCLWSVVGMVFLCWVWWFGVVFLVLCDSFLVWMLLCYVLVWWLNWCVLFLWCCCLFVFYVLLLFCRWVCWYWLVLWVCCCGFLVWSSWMMVLLLVLCGFSMYWFGWLVWWMWWWCVVLVLWVGWLELGVLLCVFFIGCDVVGIDVNVFGMKCWCVLCVCYVLF